LPTSRYRIAGGALVLALFVVVLPIRLNHASNEASAETCVRLADHPPAADANAVNELERCRAAVPDDVELLADLGTVYERSGRTADAEKIYREALAIDPSYADLHTRLATLLLARGSADAARVHAEHALRIQPNRTSVIRLLDEIESRPRP
jgi:tetratricopeptide (TPR) repeat protein